MVYYFQFANTLELAELFKVMGSSGAYGDIRVQLSKISGKVGRF